MCQQEFVSGGSYIRSGCKQRQMQHTKKKHLITHHAPIATQRRGWPFLSMVGGALMGRVAPPLSWAKRRATRRALLAANEADGDATAAACPIKAIMISSTAASARIVCETKTGGAQRKRSCHKTRAQQTRLFGA